MPEIAEVERARRLVAAHCLNRTITDVVTDEAGGGALDGQFDAKIFEGLEADAFQKALRGNRISRVGRRGKQLWFVMEGPDGKVAAKHPTFHFAMSGSFVVKGVKAPTYGRWVIDDSLWPPKWTKCQIEFEGGVVLAFVCMRRMGRIGLVDDADATAVVSSMGPDVHEALPSVEELLKIFSTKGGPIKAVLMDQSVLAGIGNWVADDVMYEAAIHPMHPAKLLTAEEVTRLRAAIETIVGGAIEVNAESSGMPAHWLIHVRGGNGRKDAPTRTPRDEPFTWEKVGGRSSIVVPKVMKKTWSKRVATPKAGRGGAGEQDTKSTQPAAKAAKATRGRSGVTRKGGRGGAGGQGTEPQKPATMTAKAAKRRRGGVASGKAKRGRA